jgi:methyl-accepting chemotaxis protein/CHASE3 domain sensor protein
MKWLNNFKFGFKIVCSFFLIIVLAVISSVISIIYMAQITTSSDTMDLSGDIVQTVLQAGNDRRDLISTGESTYGNEVLSAVDDCVDILDEIIDTTGSAEIVSAAEDMKVVFDDYVPVFEDVIAAEENMNSAESVWVTLGQEFSTVVAQLKTAAADDTDVLLQVDSLEGKFYLMRVSAVNYGWKQTDEAYQSLQKAISDTDAELSALESMIAGNSSLATGAASVSANIEEYLAQSEKFHQALEDQNDALSELTVLAQELNGSDDDSSAYYGGAALLTAEAVADLESAENLAKTIQIAICIAIVILGVLISFVLVSSTTKPLKVIVDAGNALAIGDTNKNIHLDYERRDEIGEIALCFHNVVASQREMTDGFEKMANGDLTIEFKPRSDKDVMGIAFVKMLNDLRALMTKLTNTAKGLTEASAQLAKASEQAGQATQQIASTSQQVAKGASEQSASLQETTRAIDQLSTAIEQISKGAQEQSKGIEKTLSTVREVAEAAGKATSDARAASSNSAESAKVAEDGAVMAKQTVDGMEKIREAIGFTSQKITRLGEQSGEIDKIVATIDDIAAQTNLLALNAAIEAARAGEQGRGFAVVADEVRKLAERSLRATKEIADLIIGIQTGVNDAVKAMEDSTSYVENGYKLAADCGDIMSEIIKYADNVGYDVTRISAATVGLTKLGDELLKVTEEISSVVEENTAATEQMAASSDQVSKSVESVAGVAEENGAATEEVSASAEEMSAQVEEVVASAQSLSAMADELSKAVSVFKLSKN